MKALRMPAVKKRLRVAGLMSGTSADGVSVAIVDFAGRKLTLRAFGTVPYPPDVRAQVLRISEPGRGRIDELCRLNFALGEVFAAALVTVARKNRIPLSTLDLIGSHGQTVCHLPAGTGTTFPSSGTSCLSRPAVRTRAAHPVGSTLQIAEPCVIAERTGITTVADFRPRDVAAGGEGAPLVPFADWLLLGHATRSRCIQNVGGIANVTFLRAGLSRRPAREGAPADVLAFDTGPGNMMIDATTRRITRGRREYDAGGRLAAKGKVNDALLRELMRHPFLRRRPPKSTGREEFGRSFTEALYARARRRRIPPRDVLATVTAFTARSIADAYRRFLPARIDDVILCGGGAHNRTLVRMLASALPGSRVAVMDAFGIPSDAKEAVSFALLARETICGRPSNVPAATGARRAVVLGKIIPGK